MTDFYKHRAVGKSTDPMHEICRDRLKLFGGSNQCCTCNPHENCLLINQNDGRTTKTKTEVAKSVS